VDDGGFGAGEFDDELGEFFDGEFDGVSEVDGSDEVVWGVHQAEDAIDEVVDIAEGSGL